MPDAKEAVLVVLFIPSVERDGKTLIDQDRWVTEAFKTFGTLFGGATAFPKARGVWKDVANGGRLIFDEPIMFHCYTTREQVEDAVKLSTLRDFCCRMGRETNQGEVGLVVDGEFLSITDF